MWHNVVRCGVLVTMGLAAWGCGGDDGMGASAAKVDDMKGSADAAAPSMNDNKSDSMDMTVAGASSTGDSQPAGSNGMPVSAQGAKAYEQFSKGVIAQCVQEFMVCAQDNIEPMGFALVPAKAKYEQNTDTLTLVWEGADGSVTGNIRGLAAGMRVGATRCGDTTGTGAKADPVTSQPAADARKAVAACLKETFSPYQ